MCLGHNSSEGFVLNSLEHGHFDQFAQSENFAHPLPQRMSINLRSTPSNSPWIMVNRMHLESPSHKHPVESLSHKHSVESLSHQHPLWSGYQRKQQSNYSFIIYLMGGDCTQTPLRQSIIAWSITATPQSPPSPFSCNIMSRMPYSKKSHYPKSIMSEFFTKQKLKSQNMEQRGLECPLDSVKSIYLVIHSLQSAEITLLKVLAVGISKILTHNKAILSLECSKSEVGERSEIIHDINTWRGENGMSGHVNKYKKWELISFRGSNTSGLLFPNNSYIIHKQQLMSRLQYAPLEIQKNPRTAVTQSAQSKHWQLFKSQYTSTSKNLISNIASNLNSLNHIFYSSGRELSLYSTTTSSILKTVSSFTDNISTVSVRKDGLMFAVGFESGKVQVMDVKNMLNLRVFNNHLKRVNALEYANINQLYSAGDDKIIRQFDVVANAVIHSFPNAHKDYIKCLGYLGDNHIVSGGYDNHLKIFDFRVHKQDVMVFDHLLPVESLAVMPTKLSFASVGGTSLKVWDIRANRVLFQNFNNKKTLTTVRILAEGDRILTTSLDQQLKIYNSNTLQVTYQQKYQDAIIAFDITEDSKHLAVGMNNGKIIIKGMSSKVEEEVVEDEGDIPAAWKLVESESVKLNNSYFYRGIYSEPGENQVVVENVRNRTGFYDKCLKKFEYKRALVSSITKNEMHILNSLVEELNQRGVLKRTLKHLEEDELRVLLKLVTRRVSNQKYREVLLEITSLVFELHSKRYGRLREWGELLEALGREIEVEQELVEQLGMLETISNIMA